MELLTGSSNPTLTLSLYLVILALVLAVVFRTLPRTIRAFAMAVSFAADLMLGQYPPFLTLTGGYSFPLGAVMFMAAHLLYFTSYVLLIRESGKRVFNPGFFVGCAVTLGAIIALTVLYFQNPLADPGMLLLGIAYGLVIGTLCTAVCTHAFIKKGIAFASMAGILSFMASDMVIGLSRIGGVSFYNSGEIIWFFYPIGQLLILL